jgi:hypothetical protein
MFRRKKGRDGTSEDEDEEDDLTERIRLVYSKPPWFNI